MVDDRSPNWQFFTRKTILETMSPELFVECDKDKSGENIILFLLAGRFDLGAESAVLSSFSLDFEAESAVLSSFSLDFEAESAVLSSFSLDLKAESSDFVGSSFLLD